MMLSRFWWALLLCPLMIHAQDVSQGKALFRSNCAFCHGLTGAGGRGPTLSSGRFNHAATDADLKNIIRHGIPGTGMPGFEMQDDDLTQLVAFIHSLASSGAAAAVPGDPARGQAVYSRSGCAGCHSIAGHGSIFGPDLSRIGAARSVDYIRQSLTDPSADIPEEYEGVAVVTRDGRRVTGVRINEDTFTVQLRDGSQEFRMFRKDEVARVEPLSTSLMPPYKALPAPDLQDLVAYLVSLRGPASSAAAQKAEGIR